MKKTLMLVALLALSGAFSMAMADDSAPNKVKFVGAVGIGGAVPVDGFGSAYSSGAGIDGNLGFQFDENFSLLLEIDSFIFQTNVIGIYSAEVNMMPAVKYAFGTSKTKFYLLGALGMNVNQLFLTSGGTTVTLTQKNFAIGPGLGVQFPLNDGLDLYLQAKFVDVFADATFSYIPMTIGLNFM